MLLVSRLKIIPRHEYWIGKPNLRAYAVSEGEVRRLKIEWPPTDGRRIESDHERSETIFFGALEDGKGYLLRTRPFSGLLLGLFR